MSQSLKSSVFKDPQCRKTCVKLLTCDTFQDDTDILVADVQYEKTELIDTQLDISNLSRLNVLQLWKFWNHRSKYFGRIPLSITDTVAISK